MVCRETKEGCCVNTPQTLVTLPKADTPQGMRQRRDQLRAAIKSLREAEFPHAYDQFAPLAEALGKETSEGKRVQDRWRNHVAQKCKVPGINNPPLICPPAVFLPMLQAELAGAAVRRWTNLTAGLPSPKRMEAAKEPVPATRAALYQEAQHEEEVTIANIRAELDGTAALMQFQKALQTNSSERKPKKRDPKARQRNAQWEQDYTSGRPKICVWSKPMSQSDYRKATGQNRKTVERWLKRINAKPALLGRHAADPDRYSADVNLQILSKWIGSPSLNAEHARGLAAATIAYANAYDEAFEGEVIRVLIPVLERRKLIGPKFGDDLKAHQKLYAPPPPAPFLKIFQSYPQNA